MPSAVPSTSAVQLRMRALITYNARQQQQTVAATVGILQQSLQAAQIRRPSAGSLLQILNIQA